MLLSINKRTHQGNDGSCAGEDPIEKAKDSPLEWSENSKPAATDTMLSNSHSKGDSVSSLTVDPQGCRNEQNHLPCTHSQCPKCPNTSTNHLKTSNSALFTRFCRCLPSQKDIGSFSCLNEEGVRGTEEIRPSSAHHAVANGTGHKLPWYLTVIHEKFERLRVKIIQAAYSAPGAKQPQAEITDAALLQTMQKIIDDRTAFHQRLQQKGEKMAPLTTAETHSVKTTPASDKN
ncbi:uncharacterized protein LOC118207574 isoform X2 [Anguilla anguilla]|uniref:uncharacterized protein LOC118207574 isoform X2 n=1 Tax=Anguilla anguilla TaxID=7936 RepID=UPI0015AA236E|nr:uncharacterized protein LOC118207574 isoform X2 [Anguilla anguilla]